jgi:hypothetical protein
MSAPDSTDSRVEDIAEIVGELEERLRIAEARIRELYFTKADDMMARLTWGPTLQPEEPRDAE